MDGFGIVPEDHEFELYDGRKSQGGGWAIGTVGGDAAKSSLMVDCGRVRAMVGVNYEGKCRGGY
jgi:hypothetical protein